MLGRTASGTLQLSVDSTGLLYSVSVPNTTLGNDTYELVQRGDFFESSFVFTVDDEGQYWTSNADGDYRFITSVTGLYDCSVCVDGAYATDGIEARNSVSLHVNI